jgi:acetyl-CoA synthetase
MPENPSILREQEDNTVIKPLVPAGRKPLILAEDYTHMYRQSIQQPEVFWASQAKQLDWIAPWQKVKNTSFEGDVSIKWFEGGKLNVSANCIDRHLEKRGNQTAILWEGDNPNESKAITYRELYEEVCRLTNVLRDLGVKKGDRVTIYLPMIPEAAYAMLACTRIGAIHSVVFAGFSANSLKGRIEDAESYFVITADEGMRGGKTIPLKNTVDEAISTLDAGFIKQMFCTQNFVLKPKRKRQPR